MLLNAVEGELAFELNIGGVIRRGSSSCAKDLPPRASLSTDSGEVTLPNPAGVEDSGSSSVDEDVARIPRRMRNRSCCDACR